MTNTRDVADVIKLHDSIVEQFGGLPGIRDEKLLSSALERPFTGLSDGTEFFPAIERKAAVLLHSLIQFHPFIDGNKRTAVAITQIYLRVSGFSWNYTQTEIVDFALDIANSVLNLDSISDWISKRVSNKE
ncbi:MAG TPA: type II toxin-antitoxin system death-on-curing family toxin [Bacteroidota bacterium]